MGDLHNLDSLQKHLDETIPDEVLLDETAELPLLPNMEEDPQSIILKGKFTDFTELDPEIFESHAFENPVIELFEDE